MGRYERRPDNLRGKGDPYGSAETAIRAVTEELQILQRNLLKSLHDDMKRLQVEKDRLTEDIKRLQEEKEHLQQGHEINEQQALIRQLSQVLASHISTQLQSSLETLATQARETRSPTVSSEPDQTTSSSASEVNEYAEKLLDSLDDTLTITFNSLQQELKNYQSSLSQQLSRMSVQQREGEAILIELVNRLRSQVEETTAETSPPAIREIPLVEIEQTQQQPHQPASEEVPTKLQTDIPLAITVRPSSPPQEETSARSSVSQSIVLPSETPQSHPPEPTPVASPPLPATSQPPQVMPRQLQRQTGMSSLQLTGIILLVLSTVASALYNIVIKVIFLPGSQIFGVFDVERVISPTLGNSLLILMLRMLVVVPLMLVLAPILHSRVWQDLQYLGDSIRGNSSNPTAKRVLVLSIVSGCFLFLSQVLIYLAIGQVPTGVAIALFFVYPVISGLLSWSLFGDRLTFFSFGAMAAIGLGELLVLGSSSSTVMRNIPLGSIAAIASGTAFAFYLIFSRKCAAKLHPVSFTLINFATMLFLSVFGLILPLPTNWNLQLNPAYFLELVLCAFLLGVLTLFSYLLNNFGIRKIGASRSAIIGATIPVITGILAGLIIQETLQIEQVLGVLLVTFGAAAFCFEKIRNRHQPYNNSSN
ncbi:EamA family transporter [Mastigocladopsis repens]|uniref:EamA family transporter n=1 Tax=Mastigocladopsis repens TaxID=221287 RepID=UPI0002D92460|nr:EamA family transporter [Mastigocladopsis repens]